MSFYKKREILGSSKQLHELPGLWTFPWEIVVSWHINQRLSEEILRAHTSLIDDNEASQRPHTVGEADALC